jgi:glycerol-3-phosphate dehydrogenase
VIVGTTDTKVENPEIEPRAKQEEVDFIVENLNKYLNKPVSKNDISAVYAGVRPLIKQSGASTSSISREEHMEISPSNLVSLIGGKWTAYRRICEKLANFVLDNKLLPKKSPCITETIKINNYLSQQELVEIPDEFKFYGKAYHVMTNHPEFKDLIHPKYPYNYAQVKYAIENEYALTLDDVLARRIRLLFLDSSVATEVAPNVAKYMATLLHKDSVWVDNQIKEFNEIAKNYLTKTFI